MSRTYTNLSETVYFLDYKIIGDVEIYVELAVLNESSDPFVVELEKTLYVLQLPKVAKQQLGLILLCKATFLVLDKKKL